ncbi:hypothetical protein KIW84_024621 [Lathyrus oleraceus]|uniref:Uncharacterized protein n=1 Tax=Pisum sativum TaxID=3888 RepID=A0A9D4YG66_PEA|nr:hypothetical protein KIW84_024621 [Pisum sativum]
MSYACERPMSLVVAEPLALPNQDVEELEDALAKMKQERDMWEERFHALMKRQKEPDGSSSSSMPQPSGAWKKIVDQLVLEKAQMKTSFESEIRRIRRKYAPTVISSDTVARGSLG